MPRENPLVKVGTFRSVSPMGWVCKLLEENIARGFVVTRGDYCSDGSDAWQGKLVIRPQ